MMKMFSAKRSGVLVLCGLAAVTMLSGCWVTAPQLEERLATYTGEQKLAATRGLAEANTGKLATVGQQVTALTEWKATLAGITETVEKITNDLEAMKTIPTRMTGCESSLTQHETRLTTLDNDAKAAKLARAELLAGLGKAALKSDQDKLSKSLDAAVAGINADVKLLKSKDETHDTTIKKLDTFREAMVTQLTGINTAVAKLDSKMNDLSKETKTSMASQDKKIAGLSGGMSTALGEEIKLLEKRIATLKQVLAGFGDSNGGAGGAGTNGGSGQP